jgi:hypothetical protein
MKRTLTVLCLSLLLTLSVLAQDQKAQLAQALKADGSPLEGQILMHLVELDMSPEWWNIMLDPGEERRARQSLRILLSSIPDLGEHMGLGDLAGLDDDTGRKGDSPPVLGMLKSWQPKIKLKVVMKFAPDETSKKETTAGLDRMAYPIGTIAKPRPGSFDMTITYDPQVTEISGNVSADGGTYSFTLPGFMSWSQSKVDAYMKRGH